ncbi:MAG: response regulator [Thermoanaerobaculia bacterium]
MSGKGVASNRILVVIAEPATRGLVQRILESVLLHVDTASRYEQAIDKIRAGAFDVLVLDPALPRVDGAELLRTLQREHPRLARRTIVLAEPGSPIAEKLAAVPTCRRVSRAVRRQELIAAVSDCLRDMDDQS